MKVDLVYLWVDDSDGQWFEKRNKYIGNNVERESADDCRFRNNDELKYSLRSVEKYANWINKIFIVTDNQIPTWLNTSNERIRIVDHSEIIPKDKLPIFNSCVIENRVPFIQELSEYFLLANDDTLFWNDVNPNFFFSDGKVVFRVGKRIKNKQYRHLYGHSIYKSYQMVKQRFGESVPFFPHHNIDSYLKSDFSDCIKEFQTEFDETLNHKFRTSNDVQRIAVSYYSVLKNHAIIKRVQVNQIKKFLGLEQPDSEYFGLRKSTLSKIKRTGAKLVCINDNRKTTDSDRIEIIKILEEKFSNKSSFER